MKVSSSAIRYFSACRRLPLIPQIQKIRYNVKHTLKTLICNVDVDIFLWYIWSILMFLIHVVSYFFVCCAYKTMPVVRTLVVHRNLQFKRRFQKAIFGKFLEHVYSMVCHCLPRGAWAETKIFQFLWGSNSGFSNIADALVCYATFAHIKCFCKLNIL